MKKGEWVVKEKMYRCEDEKWKCEVGYVKEWYFVIFYGFNKYIV